MSGIETLRSPDEIARLCAETMWKTDGASQGLGVEIREIAAGRAVLSMRLADHMVNGHGSAHGGYIFALADSAFAFACNTYDERTVAAHCSISFLRPGKRGHELVATAREVTRAGRSGIYDISVTQDGVLIAEFRGHSRSIGGAIIPQDDKTSG